MKKLVITNLTTDNITGKLSMLFDGNKEIRIELYDNEKSILDNIYVARVRDIVRNIDAAFVEIEPGQICYFSIKENPRPIFLNLKNSCKLCQGDLLLVQVKKDRIKSKAPMVSCGITFSGRYAAITREQAGRVGVSHRISDTDRTRADELKRLAQPYVTQDYGFIIRTDASDAENGLIEDEIRSLVKEYNDILEKAKHRTAFSLIRSEKNIMCKDIESCRLTAEDEIITDDRQVYEMLNGQTYAGMNFCAHLRFYEDRLLPLIKLYEMEQRLEHALSKRVWLKSGGYLVIEPTEALTVIDVNTGKFDGKGGDREETFLKINLEACREIARQLILRNISGIIIVDFINLKDKDRREILEETMKSLLANDPVKSIFIEFTKLGLMEITRKKIKRPLWEAVKGDTKNAESNT